MGSKRFEADGILYVHYFLTFSRHTLLPSQTRKAARLHNWMELALHYAWPRANRDCILKILWSLWLFFSLSFYQGQISPWFHFFFSTTKEWYMPLNMVDEQIIVKSCRVSCIPKWNIKHYAALTWVESTRTYLVHVPASNEQAEEQYPRR